MSEKAGPGFWSRQKMAPWCAAAHFDRGALRGSLLVALDGQIMFEKGYGWANLEGNIPNSSDSVF